MPAKRRDPMARVRARPSPEQWRDDDIMTLDEAIAVFWPYGPLTATSLRTEIRHGRLIGERIAGKLLITPAGLRAMRERCREPTKSIPPALGLIKGGRRHGAASAGAQLKLEREVALARTRQLIKDAQRRLKKASERKSEG